MKGDAKVIELLNEVLKAELTAINQYFLHAEMCDNWGYESSTDHPQGVHRRDEARRDLMERILYLEGTPNISDSSRSTSGRRWSEQFKNDLQLENGPSAERGHQGLPRRATTASRELLENILVDEEEHVDWLEAQLHAIEQMGIQNYLAQQVKAEG